MILGYIRCSTEDQVKGSTLQEQENVIRGYAMTQGVDRFGVQIYTDPDVSAKIPLRDRPDGARLLAEAQPGDTIIAAKMDRIFRSARDALEIADHCMAEKINLVLFDMGVQPVTGDGPSRMFFTMLAAFAEFERGRIRERMVTGKEAKARAGGHIGGEAPYGYRIVGAGREAKLEENPQERAIVEIIRGEIQSPKFSNTAMMRKLNGQGLLNRSGKPFATYQVQRIAERLTAQ